MRFIYSLFGNAEKQEKMNGKARTEMACSLSWFNNWNEVQREEFGKILIQSQNGQETEVDGNLDALMNQLSLGGRSEGPSIFECQLKIFQKWYSCWNPADKSEFAVQLNAISPDFISTLNAKLH